MTSKKGFKRAADAFLSDKFNDDDTNGVDDIESNVNDELSEKEKNIQNIEIKAEDINSMNETAIENKIENLTSKPKNENLNFNQKESITQENTVRLKQTGYYIRNDQHSKLKMMAVLRETDASDLVRQALDLFFKHNE